LTSLDFVVVKQLGEDDMSTRRMKMLHARRAAPEAIHKLNLVCCVSICGPGGNAHSLTGMP
jgi:hypothetical protein